MRIPDNFFYVAGRPDYPFLLERMPLALRKEPESENATDTNGTPFLIKQNSFTDTPLEGHGREREGSYFIHLVFFYCLWRSFRGNDFHRGNLDKARLHFLLSDGVLEIINSCHEHCYQEVLRINKDRALEAFPAAFED